jgi:hypothetical protein
MSWVAVAIGSAAVLNYVNSREASRSAAQAQTDAANISSETQLAMFNQQRQDQEPWRQSGIRALAGMEGGDYMRDFTAADFQADPGYQFRMAEGMKAIENSASARGMVNSTVTMKNLARFNQDLASQEYQNAYDRFNSDRTTRFNRLASLAGTGQTATNQVGQAGQNTANQISANQLATGNANAARYVADANSLNNLVNTGTNTWMQYQLLDTLKNR